MRSTTLGDLRDRIRWRADIVSDTARHTNADLTAEINQAIVELRTRLTMDGSELYLASTTGTLTTTAAGTGENYVSITGPATAEQVVAIDILDDGSLFTLEYVTLSQRLLMGSDTDDGQYPLGWGLLDIDSREIAIYPIPDEAYTYVLWYQTQLTDLSGDSDTLTVLPGFFDFITWKVALAIAIRDDIPRLKVDAERGSETSYRIAFASATNVGKRDPWRKDTRAGSSRLTAAGRFRTR